MTSTQLNERYAVHELLFPGDVLTSCALEDLHPAESPGRDIPHDPAGTWLNFLDSGPITVDAAPIQHRGEGLDTTL